VTFELDVDPHGKQPVTWLQKSTTRAFPRAGGNTETNACFPTVPLTGSQRLLIVGLSLIRPIIVEIDKAILRHRFLSPSRQERQE
jgi:hypothetical protein